MPLLQAVRAVTSKLNTEDMLRYLITDKFAGKTVVTASLRTTSIVTLKMVSDIDPATPVVFVRPGAEFPDTKAYQDEIVERFGLTNFSVTVGRETTVQPKDLAHCERMWVEYENSPGMSYEVTHINDTVAPYDCWISAVYHVRRADHVRYRVDKEGRIIRVDPLTRWTMDDVYAYLKEHDIPVFKRALRAEQRTILNDETEQATTYAF